jgi:hypothetical protein
MPEVGMLEVGMHADRGALGGIKGLADGAGRC